MYSYGIKVTSGEVDLCGVDYDELNAVKFMLIIRTTAKMRRLLERIEKHLCKEAFQFSDRVKEAE